jgi:hypothetical protein
MNNTYYYDLGENYEEKLMNNTYYYDLGENYEEKLKNKSSSFPRSRYLSSAKFRERRLVVISEKVLRTDDTGNFAWHKHPTAKLTYLTEEEKKDIMFMIIGSTSLR